VGLFLVALDGADGWIARREAPGEFSEFFDKEVTLVCSCYAATTSPAGWFRGMDTAARGSCHALVYS
jgi:hypothetical protein